MFFSSTIARPFLVSWWSTILYGATYRTQIVGRGRHNTHPVRKPFKNVWHMGFKYSKTRNIMMGLPRNSAKKDSDATAGVVLYIYRSYQIWHWAMRKDNEKRCARRKDTSVRRKIHCPLLSFFSFIVSLRFCSTWPSDYILLTLLPNCSVTSVQVAAAQAELGRQMVVNKS